MNAGNVMKALLILAVSTAFGSILNTRSGMASPEFSQMEEFTISAQYRGVVKKLIPHVGNGKVLYESNGEGKFRMRIAGSAKHPDWDSAWEFKIRQTFQLDGQILTVTNEEREFSDANQQRTDRLLQVVPFAYLARQNALPSDSESPVRTYKFQDKRYDLRYRKSERQMEVELYAADELVGKFFLAADWQPGQERLEKFRILFPDDDVVISFVRGS